MATKDTMTTTENLPSQPDNRHPTGLPGVLRDNTNIWRQERQDAAEDAALDASLKRNRTVARVGTALGTVATITGMAISRDAARASESEALAEQRAAHTVVLSTEQLKSDFITDLNSPEEPQQQETYFSAPGLPEFQLPDEISEQLPRVFPGVIGVKKYDLNINEGSIQINGFVAEEESDFRRVIQILAGASGSIAVNGQQPYAHLEIFYRYNPDGTHTASPILVTDALIELEGEGGQTETLNAGSPIWLDESEATFLYLSVPAVEGAKFGVVAMTEQFRQDLIRLGADSNSLPPVRSFLLLTYYTEGEDSRLLSLSGYDQDGNPTGLVTPLYAKLTGGEANLSHDITTPEPASYEDVNASETKPERLSAQELEALINQDSFLTAQGPVTIKRDYGIILEAVTEEYQQAHPDWKNRFWSEPWAQDMFKTALLATALYGDETTVDHFNNCLDNYQECLGQLRNGRAVHPDLHLFTQVSIKVKDGESNPSHRVPVIDVLEGRIPVIYLSGADGPVWEWGDGERLIDSQKTNKVVNASVGTIALTEGARTFALVYFFDGDPHDWGYNNEDAPVAASFSDFLHQTFEIIYLGKLVRPDLVEVYNTFAFDFVFPRLPQDFVDAIQQGNK